VRQKSCDSAARLVDLACIHSTLQQVAAAAAAAARAKRIISLCMAHVAGASGSFLLLLSSTCRQAPQLAACKLPVSVCMGCDQ
jgi:hypothetical protein